MKMKVIRDRPVRYPSGPDGREYKRDEEFTVLSERDAKAFTLVRAAVVVDETKKTSKKAEPAVAVPAQPSLSLPATQPASAEPMSTAVSPLVDDAGRRRYTRRDMRSEG